MERTMGEARHNNGEGSALSGAPAALARHRRRARPLTGDGLIIRPSWCRKSAGTTYTLPQLAKRMHTGVLLPMEVKTSHVITVEPLGDDESAWNELLARSANGTLFHDLRFLRYHPADRFEFHHLMLRRNGKPVALLPGGLCATAHPPMFCSPLGASIGGFAVAELRAESALSLVEAVQDYARARGWAAVEITLAPAGYNFETAGLIEFALFCRGFRLVRRWLCLMLPLIAQSRDGF